MTETGRKLTRDEWEQLNDQFLRAPDPDEGASASGEHYMLNFILNKRDYLPSPRLSPTGRRKRTRKTDFLAENYKIVRFCSHLPPGEGLGVRAGRQL
ncbi:MAG: hypothetical protein ACOYY3_14590, partial [Chloroflexota bacterium]